MVMHVQLRLDERKPPSHTRDPDAVHDLKPGNRLKRPRTPVLSVTV